MQETGIVVEIEKDHLLLRMDPAGEALCKRCGGCGACGAGSEGARLLRLPLQDPVREAHRGDRVTVELVLPNTALAAALLFGLPLLGLFLGGGTAFGFFPDSGSILGLAAILGLGAGVGAVWLANRLLERKGRATIRAVSLDRIS
ncbi:MAG: SoxR reducing system RseC family protein [Planctomycetota bacterium]